MTQTRKITAAALRGYPELMTPVDAQKVLNVGRSKVYGLLTEGAIASLRVGRKIRIPKAYLLDYLNS
jgi:excisionase family DNA binding protein